MLARRRQWFHGAKVDTGAAVANWGLRKAAASHPFGSLRASRPSTPLRTSCTLNGPGRVAELTGTQDANEAIKLSKGSALEDIRMGTLAARFSDFLAAFATVNR
jgi:hypothetical protein